MLDYSHLRTYNYHMAIYIDMDKTLTGVDNPYTRIDKYSVLKWIFSRKQIRNNDELEQLLNDLKKDKTYFELDVINTLIRLITDNALENVAALDCVKIIIE